MCSALSVFARKIAVFLVTVGTIVIIVGAAMYQIEGEANGFTSIPAAMYWAIVTVTTVGYGDISPKTIPGRILASLRMIIGYGIIAVPTGIVTFEFARTAGPAFPAAFVRSAASRNTIPMCCTANIAARLLRKRTRPMSLMTFRGPNCLPV